MVDKVEIGAKETGAEAPETTEAPKEEEATVTEEKPKWLPDKFKTPEDMAKAYGELEKQFTKERQESKEQPEKSDSLEIDAKETVENAGLNFQEFTDSYAKNGELSENDYSKLEKAGISKDIVDQYIAGQQAIANQVQGEIYSQIGGKEAYTEMVQWASDNMTEQEVSAFNDSLIINISKKEEII